MPESKKLDGKTIAILGGQWLRADGAHVADGSAPGSDDKMIEEFLEGIHSRQRADVEEEVTA